MQQEILRIKNKINLAIMLFCIIGRTFVSIVFGGLDVKAAIMMTLPALGIFL